MIEPIIQEPLSLVKVVWALIAFGVFLFVTAAYFGSDDEPPFDGGEEGWA